jgi:hypothetical protein
MSFTAMLDDLYNELERNRDRLMKIKRNVIRLFNELNSISEGVGLRYGVLLVVSLFDTNKVLAFDTYGRENVTVVIDKFRNRFLIPKDVIKAKAREVFKDKAIEIMDALAYENNEGVKIFFKDGRIDVLPGSFHVWRVIDDDVKVFCDWLMKECYKVNDNKNNK